MLRLNGILVTARDKVHKLIVEGRLHPNWEDYVLIHAGPIVRGNRIIALGPTTSTRMANLIEKVVENTGVRVIIGKGGLGRRGASICKRLGCVYLAFTGGAAALGAKSVKRVLKVENVELGEAEATYYLEVTDFGPLVVAIDRYGNDIYLQTLCRTATLVNAYLEDI